MKEDISKSLKIYGALVYSQFYYYIKIKSINYKYKTYIMI